MQIMHLRFTSEKIIPTVHGGSIEELVCQISPKGQDMAPQDLRRQGNRDGIGEDVLDRMCILSSQGDGSNEAMMPLVNADVEPGDME